jgi:hypothetical protein
VTKKEFQVGTLVKFYDAFNSFKPQSIGIILTPGTKRSGRGSDRMYSVLLENGERMEIFEYEMREA